MQVLLTGITRRGTPPPQCEQNPVSAPGLTVLRWNTHSIHAVTHPERISTSHKQKRRDAKGRRRAVSLTLILEKDRRSFDMFSTTCCHFEKSRFHFASRDTDGTRRPYANPRCLNSSASNKDRGAAAMSNDQRNGGTIPCLACPLAETSGALLVQIEDRMPSTSIRLGFRWPS